MANFSTYPKVYECNSRKITIGLNLKDTIATYTVKIFKNLDVHNEFSASKVYDS